MFYYLCKLPFCFVLCDLNIAHLVKSTETFKCNYICLGMLNHPLTTENKTEEVAPSSATCEIEMISGMRPHAYKSETIQFNAAFREATWSFGTRLLLTHRFSHKVKRGLVSNHFLPSAAFSLTKATFTDNNSSSCSSERLLKILPRCAEISSDLI